MTTQRKFLITFAIVGAALLAVIFPRPKAPRTEVPPAAAAPRAASTPERGMPTPASAPSPVAAGPSRAPEAAAPARPATADRALSADVRQAMESRQKALNQLQFEAMPRIDGCLAPVMNGPRQPTTLRLTFRREEADAHRYAIRGVEVAGQQQPGTHGGPLDRCLNQLTGTAVTLAEADPASSQNEFSQIVTLLLPVPGPARGTP